jgi:hypothetical protein
MSPAGLKIHRKRCQLKNTPLGGQHCQPLDNIGTHFRQTLYNNNSDETCEYLFLILRYQIDEPRYEVLPEIECEQWKREKSSDTDD